MVLTKDYILEKDGRDVISVDKQFGFVHPEPDEEIYYTTTFPDGKEKTVYYYPNEENEYCDIIFIDEFVNKNQELLKKQKF